MFVVVGATGNTGSVVADTLLSQKQPVRIVVRSADKGAAWKAKGAEIAVASLDDVSSLTKHLKEPKASISWCRRTMGQRRGWPTNEHEWIVLQKR